MATAASNQTVDSTGTNIFSASADTAKYARTIVIRCVSANDALVNIPGLHKAGEFARVPIGQQEPFALDPFLQTVFVKGSGGNTVIDYHVAVGGGRG